MRNTAKLSLIAFAAIAALSSIAIAQTAGPVDPRLYAGLTWRNLGPFRGGRVAAVSGAIGQPGVFYIGLPGGGVWKTTSAGQIWYPVFDSVKDVSSIGAVEVAPSDPNVVYVGTGDMITGGAINEGNGVYKSNRRRRDVAAHRSRRRRSRSRRCSSASSDPNLVLVAAQGDVHHKSRDRGVFRSTDGGATWTQTLFVDDSTGVQKLARAFDTPNVIFATTVLALHAARRRQDAAAARAPARRPPVSPARRIFKSTDGGVTWNELTGRSSCRTPTARRGSPSRMNTNAQRVFVDRRLRPLPLRRRRRHVAAGWRRTIRASATDRAATTAASTSTRRIPTSSTPSTPRATCRATAATTFTGFKGAPGGDDPQQMWIDPTNGKRILVRLRSGRDRLARRRRDVELVVQSVHRADLSLSRRTTRFRTGSTARSRTPAPFARASAATSARSRRSTGIRCSGWEWGTIVADPLDPNTVYASGSGIVKISYPSEQWINVSPAQDAVARSCGRRATSRSASRRGISTCSSPAFSRSGDDRRRRALDGA